MWNWQFNPQILEFGCVLWIYEGQNHVHVFLSLEGDG